MSRINMIAHRFPLHVRNHVLRFASVAFLLVGMGAIVHAGNCVGGGMLRLEGVSYNTTRDVYSDVGSSFGTAYAHTGQWRDADLDGDAQDQGDHKFPLAYKVSDSVWVDEVKIFGAFAVPVGADIWVEGIGPLGNHFGDWGFVVGNYIIAANLDAHALASHVEYFENFEIDWYVQVFPIGQPPCDPVMAGTSKNRLYSTISDPPTLASGVQIKLWESMLHISSKWADLESAPAVMASKIWPEFADRVVKLVEKNGFNDSGNQALWYYKVVQPNGVGFSIEDLLRNKDGRCGAWARLFWACTHLQGSTGPRYVIQAAGNLANETLLYVKNVTEYSSTPQFGPPRYPWKEGFDFDAAYGVAGQSNPDPAAFMFTNHCLVLDGGTIYDPSYGSTAPDEKSWETASLFGWSKNVLDWRKDRAVLQDGNWHTTF